MDIFGTYKKIQKRILLSELALLIASVFVFRGLWTLLDRIPFMHTPLALWGSFIVGVVVSVLSLRYIIRHSK
ncbi:MAG: hypothetical protein K9M36_03215 [Candidatus Pacebacteria bacterium]|nr:hypothetical protein [Candidatus Paceibacterota bacterium]